MLHHTNPSEASVLESRMIRKDHVRFGGGTVEKYRQQMHQYATATRHFPTLPYDKKRKRATGSGRAPGCGAVRSPMGTAGDCARTASTRMGRTTVPTTADPTCRTASI